MGISSTAMNRALFVHHAQSKMANLDFKTFMSAPFETIIDNTISLRERLQDNPSELAFTAANIFAFLSPMALYIWSYKERTDLFIVAASYYCIRHELYQLFDSTMKNDEHNEPQNVDVNHGYSGYPGLALNGDDEDKGLDIYAHIKDGGPLVWILASVIGACIMRKFSLIVATTLSISCIAIEYCIHGAIYLNDRNKVQFNYAECIERNLTAVFFMSDILSNNPAQLYPIITNALLHNFLTTEFIANRILPNEDERPCSVETLQAAMTVAKLIFFYYGGGVNKLVIMSAFLTGMAAFKSSLDGVNFDQEISMQNLKDVGYSVYADFPILQTAVKHIFDAFEYCKDKIAYARGE